jgi:hypothetical protein
MRNVGRDLADAIEAPERTTRAALYVDWDSDGYGPAGSVDDLSGRIDNLSVSRLLISDVPAETSVVEGGAAAALSVDLVAGDSSDERLEAVRYWSRFNTASPMYGRERMNRRLRLAMEFLTAGGWRSVPRMQGITRAMPVDVGQRTAQLAALDGRQAMRAALSLPAIMADAGQTSTGLSNRQQRPGLESAWVAHFVASANGYFASPPPRPTCRLWMPMHGSAMPFIADLVAGINSEADISDTANGDADSFGHSPWTFEPGPFLLGSTPIPAGYSGRIRVATTHNQPGAELVRNGKDRQGLSQAPHGQFLGRVEFWAKAPAVGWKLEVMVDNFGASGDTRLTVRIANTGFITAEMSAQTGSPTTAVGPNPVRDGQWHFYGVHVDSANGVATFRVDNTTTVVAFQPWFLSNTWLNVTNEFYNVKVTMEQGAALSELQITAGTAATDLWLNDVGYWTPNAVIDRGYPLMGNANVDPQDSWQILTNLQAAALGAVWLDEDGVLQVAMPGRLVKPQAQQVQRTVTSLTDITDLAYDDRADTLRNRVRCPYSPVLLHIADTVFTAPHTIVLAAGTSVTFTAQLSGAFIDLPSMSVRANTAPDGTGSDVSGQVSGSATFPDVHSAIFTITNYYGGTVWLVDTAGNSAVTATGNWIESGTGAVPPDFSSVPAGQVELPLELPANPWRQTWTLAAGVAQAVLCSLRSPQQVLTKLSIPADPRLQFYDRVRVRDGGGTELDAAYWVTGMAETADSAGGYWGQMSARQARSRFVAGTGLVGVDMVG